MCLPRCVNGLSDGRLLTVESESLTASYSVGCITLSLNIEKLFALVIYESLGDHMANVCSTDCSLIAKLAATRFNSARLDSSQAISQSWRS